jgi:hypothetical protein
MYQDPTLLPNERIWYPIELQGGVPITIDQTGLNTTTLPIQKMTVAEYKQLTCEPNGITIKNDTFLPLPLCASISTSGYTNWFKINQQGAEEAQDYFICKSPNAGYNADCVRLPFRMCNYIRSRYSNYEVQVLKDIVSQVMLFSSQSITEGTPNEQKYMLNTPVNLFTLDCNPYPGRGALLLPGIVSTIHTLLYLDEINGQNTYELLLNTPEYSKIKLLLDGISKNVEGWAAESPFDFVNSVGLLPNAGNQDPAGQADQVSPYVLTIDQTDPSRTAPTWANAGKSEPYPLLDAIGDAGGGGQQLGLSMMYFSTTLQVLTSKYNIMADYDDQDYSSLTWNATWGADLKNMTNSNGTNVLDDIVDSYVQLFYGGKDFKGPGSQNPSIGDINSKAYGIDLLIDNVNVINGDKKYNIWCIVDSGWSGPTAEIFSYQLLCAAIYGKYDLFCRLHRFYYYMLYLQNGGEMRPYTYPPNQPPQSSNNYTVPAPGGVGMNRSRVNWPHISWLMGYGPKWSAGSSQNGNYPYDKPRTQCSNPYFEKISGLYSAGDADQTITLAYIIAHLAANRPNNDAAYGTFKPYDYGNDISPGFEPTAEQYAGVSSSITWKFMYNQCKATLISLNGGFDAGFPNTSGNYNYCTLAGKRVVSEGHDTDITQHIWVPDYADYSLINNFSKNVF